MSMPPDPDLAVEEILSLALSLADAEGCDLALLPAESQALFSAGVHFGNAAAVLYLQRHGLLSSDGGGTP